MGRRHKWGKLPGERERACTRCGAVIEGEAGNYLYLPYGLDAGIMLSVERIPECRDTPLPLHKTTIVIWSASSSEEIWRWSQEESELNGLAYAIEQNHGAFCSRYDSELVTDPAQDPDWGDHRPAAEGGENRYADEHGFLGPVEAAMHAIMIRSEFSSPLQEARKMLRDGGLSAQRAAAWLTAKGRDPDEEWRKGAEATGDKEPGTEGAS